MSRHEATFEVTSKSDSRAVRRITEFAYDAIREESRSVREGTADADELLAAFDALRAAARDPARGELVISYETTGETFED